MEEIARGGMRMVYKARQVSLNRIVAVKMFLADGFSSAAMVERFRTEAEAAARLEHPNIAPIREIGAHQGQHYFSRARVDAALRAARWPRPGGWLFFHDWSAQQRYVGQMDRMLEYYEFCEESSVRTSGQTLAVFRSRQGPPASFPA